MRNMTKAVRDLNQYINGRNPSGAVGDFFVAKCFENGFRLERISNEPHRIRVTPIGSKDEIYNQICSMNHMYKLLDEQGRLTPLKEAIAEIFNKEKS